MPAKTLGPEFDHARSSLAAGWFSVALAVLTLVSDQPWFAAPIAENLPWAVPLLQAATILFLLFQNFSPLEFGDRPELDNARKSLWQFRWAWRVVWYAFLVLYLGFAANAAFEHDKVVATASQIVIYIANAASTSAFLVCYFVLALRTIETHPPLSTEQVMRSEERELDGWHRALLATIAIGSFLALLSLTVPARQDSPLGFYYAAVVGFAGAVSLGIFVGRLESPYLQVEKWRLFVLYAYAALQVAYPLVILAAQSNTQIDVATRSTQLIVLGLVFPPKVLLFYTVRRAMKSGRMIFYMVRHREALDKADKEFQDFVAPPESPPAD